MKKEIREPNPNEEIIHDDEAYLLSEEKHMLNEELQNDENNIVATGNREHYEMLDEKDNTSFSNEDNNQYEINNDNININNTEEEIKNIASLGNTENPNEEIQNIETDPQNKSSLISLSSLAKCQSCFNDFDNINHWPYLLKCSHFFCKECIESLFTDDQGIKCPVDGYVAKTLSDCEMLTQLILKPKPIQLQPQKPKIKQVDNNININTIQQNDNYCKIHPDQKLSHYVEETREVICVYCAFNKMKQNPRITIKELKEKIEEYINELDTFKEKYRSFADLLQNVLNEVYVNKTNEEKKVEAIYDTMINYLINNKKVFLSKVNDLFTENKNVLSMQIENLANKIETIECLQNDLSYNKILKFNEIIDKFNLFMRDNNNISKCDISINEFRFSHDDENKAMLYLNNFGDLKSKKKNYKMSGNSGQKTQFYTQETNGAMPKKFTDNSINNFNNSLYKSKSGYEFEDTKDHLSLLNKYTYPGKTNNFLK